jgi:hypothetical protein
MHQVFFFFLGGGGILNCSVSVSISHIGLKVVKLTTLTGKLLNETETTCYSIPIAGNLQEERLQRLKHRMKVYFDPSRRDHQVRFQLISSALALVNIMWEVLNCIEQLLQKELYYFS